MNRLIALFLLPLLTNASCPAGYSYYNMTQKCYKVSSDASPYFAAVDACEGDGGSLVSIHNAFENSYLASLVSNNNLDHWIGLTNMISGYDFEWLDNSPVQYTNWAPGQPNYDASCVMMKTGNAYWTSQTCRYFLPFICEYDPAASHNPACPVQTPATSPPAPSCPTTTHPTCPACATCLPPKTCPTCPTAPPSTTPTPKPLCDAGWKYYDHTDFCYYFGNDGNVNNSVAQDRCREKGSYLVSIHSDAENSFILNNTSTGQKTQTWIGLYRTGPKPTTFANYDGTPVDYTNWNGGQPDNFNDDQYCSLMMIGNPKWPNGPWDDDNCMILLPQYVCKKPSNKN